jgi:hypothetical protein
MDMYFSGLWSIFLWLKVTQLGEFIDENWEFKLWIGGTRRDFFWEYF